MKMNLIYIVFDSCRFDSFVSAKLKYIPRLGEVNRCYSFASWTVPSHAAYLMGASPHRSPRGVFASEVYKKDFLNWSTRLNIDNVSFRNFVPQLSLPAFLKESGYRTNAIVSMPVLNQLTIVNKHFDRFELMDSHDDFSGILDKLQFDSSQPSFYLLNVGETHYPYTRKGETPDDLLHGPRGVIRHSSDLGQELLQDAPPEELFHLDRLQALHNRQKENVEYLDSLFEKLYDKVPANTHVILTSDHGECFGEGGYFGHGPIFHEKVFEVFLVEGRVD